jgi:hypothetical protein
MLRRAARDVKESGTQQRRRQGRVQASRFEKKKKEKKRKKKEAGSFAESWVRTNLQTKKRSHGRGAAAAAMPDLLDV